MSRAGAEADHGVLVEPERREASVTGVTGAADMAGPTRYFVGVDVGGTFTDVVLASSAGAELLVRKVATTPADPREGVAAGVALVLDEAGVAPGDVERVVHGTTLATNVIVERRGGPVAFVTTEGFGDLLRLGREVRGEDEHFDLRFSVPEPPVGRTLTFEVRERCDARGDVLVAPSAEHVREVAARVAAAQPAAVAICLLHAYANPAHEQLVAAACRAVLDVPVVASCEVWPEVREYERALTTVMCAYVGPVMSRYLAGLAERLQGLGVRCPVEVMESSGGVLPAELAAQRPVCTVESGGAAGVVAAGFVGGLLDVGQVISFDMGGTTAKAGIVRDGRPGVVHDFHVGGSGSRGGGRSAHSGFPIRVPVVDLAEVGAGGGSIAWVDSGGALRVGPRSSGSVPGPACYGTGGTDATVTDANLVLGFLHEGALSGDVSLSVELARQALQRHVAGPLGVDVVDAAWAVHEIANASMAAAIRMVTVQRGIDPRDFHLVGFGGAGPLHVARLAETFGIETVVVPWGAGVASAVGLVVSDLSIEQVRTRLVAEDELSVDLVQSIFADLEAAGAAALPPPAGPEARTEVLRSVDARYRGQAHQLTVPVPAGPLTGDDLVSVAKAFAARHDQVYGVTGDGPVELVSFRARVVRVVDKHRPVPRDEAPGDGAAALTGQRPVYAADLGRHVPTPVYDWPRLGPGAALVGPAVVEAPDTAVVVPTGWRASVDRWRNLLLCRSGPDDIAAKEDRGGA